MGAHSSPPPFSASFAPVPKRSCQLKPRLTRKPTWRLRSRNSLQVCLESGTIFKPTFDIRQPMHGLAKLLIGIILLGIASAQVLAQTGCIADRNGQLICAGPDANCATNRRGEIVCTTPGGGMRNDPYGELLCGPGYCVTDQRGDAFCSGLARGAAALDQTGNAVCSGGCVPAKVEACIRPVSKP